MKQGATFTKDDKSLMTIAYYAQSSFCFIALLKQHVLLFISLLFNPLRLPLSLTLTLILIFSTIAPYTFTALPSKI